jgi:hypothetical protein
MANKPQTASQDAPASRSTAKTTTGKDKKPDYKALMGTLLAIILVVVVLVLGSAYFTSKAKAKPVATVAPTTQVAAAAPAVKSPLEIQVEQLQQQLQAMTASKTAAEANQLPDGVSVTLMEERGLKKSPWKFMGWDKQGDLAFPLIANDQGRPTPIKSTTPPPAGSLPKGPAGEWVLADWTVQLPNGSTLNLNGWAKRL